MLLVMKMVSTEQSSGNCWNHNATFTTKVTFLQRDVLQEPPEALQEGMAGGNTDRLTAVCTQWIQANVAVWKEKSMTAANSFHRASDLMDF